jgi:hypothetical protein
MIASHDWLKQNINKALPQAYLFWINPNNLGKHTKHMSEIVEGLQKRCVISLPLFLPLTHAHVAGVLTMPW